MTVTFDSSAWIEYFSGSDRGRIAKKFIDSSETIYTPSICLLEIKNKYLKEGKKWNTRIDFICDSSVIVDLNSEIALLAANIKNKFGLYSIDSIVYATSRMTKSKLLTKDSHFEKFEDVMML